MWKEKNFGHYFDTKHDPQENALKNAKTNLHIYKSSNDSFTVIESNFRLSKVVKFEFKVTVHYGLWAKCIQLLPPISYCKEANVVCIYLCM